MQGQAQWEDARCLGHHPDMQDLRADVETSGLM
jgi:hypothetical protein